VSKYKDEPKNKEENQSKRCLTPLVDLYLIPEKSISTNWIFGLLRT
jgi:hypothetical protein